LNKPELPSRVALRAISHVVVEVSNLERARAFYADRLGFRSAPIDSWPVEGELCLPCLAGQWLVLKQSASPRTFADTGVHQAYGASPVAIQGIVSSLNAAAMPVHRYREDRPVERDDNVYFADPDGNRIQLVRRETTVGPGVCAIDHATVLASDMEWAEDFYRDRFGLAVEHRVGVNTDDYVRARLWGEGKDDMAPGTRRWDERYRDIPGGKPGQGRRVPRPNMQMYLQAGSSVFGIYLATGHVQEPPPHQAVGSPRTGFAVGRGELDRAATLVADARVAFKGPVEHGPKSPIAASLYVRDPCGNFIELCVPRGA
jgi:catechol 2,3-dioxygenase-like lactoylglutathione lyase family enzyme